MPVKNCKSYAAVRKNLESPPVLLGHVHYRAAHTLAIPLATRSRTSPTTPSRPRRCSPPCIAARGRVLLDRLSPQLIAVRDDAPFNDSLPDPQYAGGQKGTYTSEAARHMSENKVAFMGQGSWRANLGPYEQLHAAPACASQLLQWGRLWRFVER